MPDPHSGRPYRTARARLKAEGTGVCWLCGLPINMNAPPRTPQSWTLDHAVPASVDPGQALDPANHREAHYGCNSARGNRPAHQSKAVPVKRSRSW